MSWPIGKSSFSTRMNASDDKNGVDDVDDSYEDPPLNKIRLTTLGGT